MSEPDDLNSFDWSCDQCGHMTSYEGECLRAECPSKQDGQLKQQLRCLDCDTIAYQMNDWDWTCPACDRTNMELRV